MEGRGQRLGRRYRLSLRSLKAGRLELGPTKSVISSAGAADVLASCSGPATPDNSRPLTSSRLSANRLGRTGIQALHTPSPPDTTSRLHLTSTSTLPPPHRIRLPGYGLAISSLHPFTAVTRTSPKLLSCSSSRPCCPYALRCHDSSRPPTCRSL